MFRRKHKLDALIEALERLTVELRRQNEVAVQMHNVSSREAIKAMASAADSIGGRTRSAGDGVSRARY